MWEEVQFLKHWRLQLQGMNLITLFHYKFLESIGLKTAELCIVVFSMLVISLSEL